MGDQVEGFGPNFRLSRACIPYEEIQFGEQLGQGAFSNVFAGTCRGIPVAIKVLKKKYLPEKQLEKFKREIEIMEKIAHPNVVSFYGISFAEDNFLLVTNLMKTDLLTVLFDPQFRLSNYEKVKIGRDIARGCNWIHSLGILHRDLKSSNILVEFKGGDFDVRVCDFGLSQVQKNKELMLKDSGGPRGTINWMAPEVLSSQEFNEKSDVWGFGVVMWELITRKLPFAGLSKDEIVKLVVDEKKVLKVTTPLESLKKLVNDCLEYDPAMRPSFSTLVSALNLCSVDAAISDPIGRQLWKENFVKEESGVEESVAWGKFWDSLADFVRSAELSDLFAHVCLKEMLVKKDKRTNEELVNILEYGKLLSWFPMQSARSTMLSSISKLCARECFFGEIDKDEAERYLDNTIPGTYLIRFSSRPGTFTISRKTKSKAHDHTRLTLDKMGTYTMDGKTYQSLDAFLEAKSEYLKYPRCGSKFASFLEEDSNTNPYSSDVGAAYSSNIGSDER